MNGMLILKCPCCDSYWDKNVLFRCLENNEIICPRCLVFILKKKITYVNTIREVKHG